MSERNIDLLTRPQLVEIAKKLEIINIAKLNKLQLKKEILELLDIPDINSKQNKIYTNTKCQYPKVPKLIAIGDLHGDLSVAIKSLKLANVISLAIPNNITNIDNIEWTGGDIVVVQIGDQIDRVRPSNWENNLCSNDDSELCKDEGSDLKIFKLFEKLHKQAEKYGGAVLSLLGNHELMNVVGDFRYVSPQEFKEFATLFNSKKTLKKTGNFPFGYKERKTAFKPGGMLAKKMALTRYSVLKVGSWVFVHGGISPDLAKKYSLDEINHYVRNWLLGSKDPKNKAHINELFHTDDDTCSPFWCRIYSDPEDWEENNGRESFHKAIKFLNIKNNTNDIQGMIMGHTPQYMFGKGINSECNRKLWRIDIGASKAFGEIQKDDNSVCNRKVQVLLIENDDTCTVLKEK